MVNENTFVWSHSALSEYETCPHRFYRKRVAKDVVEPVGEHARVGLEVHSALEKAIKGEEPFPEDRLPTYAPYLKQVMALDGEKHAELKLGITSRLTGTAFDAPDVWGRAIVDVLVLIRNQPLAAVIDWKTGKPRGDTGQAARNAAAVFCNFPNIKAVVTSFVYAQHGTKVVKQFRREELPAMLAPTYRVLSEVRWSFEHEAWPRRPSGLCRAYCPVLDCPHNGKR
jgi:hypothetical protein